MFPPSWWSRLRRPTCLCCLRQSGKQQEFWISGDDDEDYDINEDDFHGDNDDTDVKWWCHLCEEIGTVSKSIVLPVEIADAGPISCLKTFSDTFVGHSFISNDDMNHNSDGSNVTFQSLEPSSALTPSQMVFPLFCFALHTLNNSHAIKLNTFKFWCYVSKRIMLIV